MKINENYVLRSVAGSWMVLPIAEATLKLNGMITLNETGTMLWNELVDESTIEELAAKLCAEYDVSFEQAVRDVEEFVKNIRDLGCLVE